MLEFGVDAGVEGHAALVKHFPVQQSDCDPELTCATIYVLCKKSTECEAHMTHKFLNVGKKQRLERCCSSSSAFLHSNQTVMLN